MAPAKIFICYKKLLAGGYKNDQADTLYYILKSDQGNFSPWLDESNLSAGMAWETAIYRRLLDSDVLLALIGKGTSESQWVRRELALATALGISIVPLGFDLSRAEMDHELDELDMGHLQGKVTDNLRMTRAEPLLAELRQDLFDARDRTLTNQKEVLKDLVNRGKPPAAPEPLKAKDNSHAASFLLRTPTVEVQLGIASGDMSRVRDVDVLVNSENDYMQMARFFESRTVSSTLRRRGAGSEDGRYRDTLQEELDWKLRDLPRPVPLASVFETSAGNPDSELSRVNKARYVFHVAAVQAVDAIAGVIPFKEPHQIELCVRSTLRKLVSVNRMDGIISPPNSLARLDQESRATTGNGAARSLLFPLFGTGHGGAGALEVIPSMVSGMVGYFADEDEDGELARTLTGGLWISVFRQTDVADVVNYLSNALVGSA